MEFKVFILVVLIPALAAFILDVFVWTKLCKKIKRQTRFIYLLRFCTLCILAYAIESFTASNTLDRIKMSIYCCLLFVTPCLILKDLDEKRTFVEWFIQVLYYSVQFALLAATREGAMNLAGYFKLI